MKILFKNANEIVTNANVVNKKGIQINKNDLCIVNQGALLWDEINGIEWIGLSKNVPQKILKRKSEVVDLDGKILTPALVDCHTHLVFAGSRHNEFAMKLEGATYQEIAHQGGGIISTVVATRQASENELFLSAQNRIETMIRMGVGVFEIKSGYGLDWISEKKVLKVIQRLKKSFRDRVVIQSTFLGAHDFPVERKKNAALREDYVKEIVEVMLPQIAGSSIKNRLADACDVFLDEGYFNYEQSKRILLRAKELGLAVKLHADELSDLGPLSGSALAAELKALSADHLLMASEKNLAALARSEVVAVLLPSTAFYLRLPYADIHKLRKSKVCMALASDYNPGSSPSLNLPFSMTLACLQMRMTMPEAFAAATYGGARALGLHETHGSLIVGKKPKMAIFDVPSYECLISDFASPGVCSLLV